MGDTTELRFSDEVVQWVQNFTGFDLGQPKAAAPAQPSAGQELEHTPAQAPAQTPAADAQPATDDRKVPRPMPEGMQVVHGKVPGPKNHLLSEPDGFVVDVDAKMIIANSLAEYQAAHKSGGGGAHENPTPADGPLGPGDEVLLGGNRYVIFADEIRFGGTVSWHARNPGNIRSGDKFGAYPGKKIHTSGAGAFAIFPDEATGMAAIPKVLKGYGKITIKQAMNKYAPSGDGANDPDKYAHLVATAMGADMDDGLDTLSDAQLKTFAEEIKKVEGWKPGTALKWDDPKVPEEIRNRLPK